MIKSIEQLELSGKRVLMRLDFNVPLKEVDGVITVSDDTRIREALPTIQYAISKGAKLILASHLGRPNGVDPKFSLEPVAHHLSQLLKLDVLLTDDCIGDGIEMIVSHLKAAQIILLENLRFHPEEEKNDVGFAHQLARLGEVYITDAFGTAHRKHASTYGVPQIMPNRGVGFLITKELKFLNKLLEDPAHPYLAVLGGSKVSDKIKTIEHLYLHVDTVLIGGAMGHAFNLAANPDHELPEGSKKPKPEEVESAKALIEKAIKHEVKLIIPVDTVKGFDIGPKTIELFKNEIKSAKTIFCNGPLGMFEKPEYSTGTFEVLKAVGNSSALKIIGGGDSLLAASQAGVSEKMDHLSTGGGASLEFLEGNGLPGIDILRTIGRRG